MAFRVPPEEDREIETTVRPSGLTKQDYITRRLLCRDVVVQGNPRVYKELGRIKAGSGIDRELLDTCDEAKQHLYCRGKSSEIQVLRGNEYKKDCIL